MQKKRKLARKGNYSRKCVLGHEPFPAACLTTSGSLRHQGTCREPTSSAPPDKSPQETGPHLTTTVAMMPLPTVRLH